MRTTLFAMALAAGLSLPVQAQHQHQHTSPYAGQQNSGIPSLTAQELDDLRSAAGMGLARAAELNHFPGPRHVLDLADSLALTPDQVREITAIRERMHAAATKLGLDIIERERTLNQRFAHQHIDAATLREITADIARLQGELRYVHLLAHIETTALLKPEQIRAYDRLRGYTDTDQTRQLPATSKSRGRP